LGAPQERAVQVVLEAGKTLLSRENKAYQSCIKAGYQVLLKDESKNKFQLKD
jgi:hypothetical protein